MASDSEAGTRSEILSWAMRMPHEEGGSESGSGGGGGGGPG